MNEQNPPSPPLEVIPGAPLEPPTAEMPTLPPAEATPTGSAVAAPPEIGSYHRNFEASREVASTVISEGALAVSALKRGLRKGLGVASELAKTGIDRGALTLNERRQTRKRRQLAWADEFVTTAGHTDVKDPDKIANSYLDMTVRNVDLKLTSPNAKLHKAPLGSPKDRLDRHVLEHAGEANAEDIEFLWPLRQIYGKDIGDKETYEARVRTESTTRAALKDKLKAGRQNRKLKHHLDPKIPDYDNGMLPPQHHPKPKHLRRAEKIRDDAERDLEALQLAAHKRQEARHQRVTGSTATPDTDVSSILSDYTPTERYRPLSRRPVQDGPTWSASAGAIPLPVRQEQSTENQLNPRTVRVRTELTKEFFENKHNKRIDGKHYGERLPIVRERSQYEKDHDWLAHHRKLMEALTEGSSLHAWFANYVSLLEDKIKRESEQRIEQAERQSQAEAGAQSPTPPQGPVPGAENGGGEQPPQPPDTPSGGEPPAYEPRAEEEHRLEEARKFFEEQLTKNREELDGAAPNSKEYIAATSFVRNLERQLADIYEPIPDPQAEVGPNSLLARRVYEGLLKSYRQKLTTVAPGTPEYTGNYSFMRSLELELAHIYRSNPEGKGPSTSPPRGPNPNIEPPSDSPSTETEPISEADQRFFDALRSAPHPEDQQTATTEQPTSPRRDFEQGEKLLVQRTSGEVEDDWYFVGISPQTGRARVEKYENGNLVRKSIPLNELRELNSTGSAKDQATPVDESTAFAPRPEIEVISGEQHKNIETTLEPSPYVESLREAFERNVDTDDMLLRGILDTLGMVSNALDRTDSEQPESDDRLVAGARNILRSYADIIIKADANPDKKSNLKEDPKKKDERDPQRHLRDVVGKVLPVLDAIDQFNNMVESNPNSLDNPSIGEAFHKFKSIPELLEQSGVEKLTAQPGEPLDPYKHNAVHSEGIGDVDIISEALTPGYKVGDILVRPANVKIRKQQS